MAITLATAQAQLQKWIDADSAVASGQSYTIGNRSLTRTDAETITKKINEWEARVIMLQRAASGRRRTRYVVTE